MTVVRVFKGVLCALGLLAAAGAIGAGAASAGGQPGVLYVAPQGHAASCTLHRPCSLGTAQSRVRSRNDAMRRDIVVRLLGGTYRLSRTWKLTNADSGHNGHRVIYEAAPGAKPVLSGGTRIPSRSWRLHDRARNIWKARVGELETRQLYVDGVRTRRSAVVPGIPGTVTRNDDGLFTTSTEPQSWTSPTDVELVWRSDGAGAFNWVEARCRVAAVSGDANGTQVDVVQPCFERAVGSYASDVPGGNMDLGAPSWAENDVSFLADDSRPGRWALKRSGDGNTLYLRPRKGQSPRRAAVVAATTETLVKVRGGGAPAKHIVLRGLRFVESTWLGPDSPAGFPNIFANGYAITPDALFDDHGEAFPPGAVDLSNTKDVRIENSRFERLGAIGVRMGDNAWDNRVTGNTFRDVSAGGVLLGRLGPDLVGEAEGNVVANNVMDGIGVEYASSPGVFTSYARATTIAHNYVANTGFTGIATRGSWNGVGTTERNHVVGNFVEEVLRRSEDGGGIYGVYIQGTSFDNGLVIEDNVVRNARDGVLSFGLYTDIGSDYTTVRNNVSYGFLLAGGGCADPYVDNVTSVDNFLDGPTLFFCGGPVTNTTIDNEFISPGDPSGSCAAIPACAAIVAQAGPDAVRPGMYDLVYSFDDHPIYEDFPGPDFPVAGVNAGVDFGDGQWITSYELAGYSSTTPARFAADGTSATLGLAPELRLKAITLEGPGTYELSDGTTTRSGSLRGIGRRLRLHTGWAQPGAQITLTLSAGSQAVIDDLVVSR